MEELSIYVLFLLVFLFFGTKSMLADTHGNISLHFFWKSMKDRHFLDTLGLCYLMLRHYTFVKSILNNFSDDFQEGWYVLLYCVQVYPKALKNYFNVYKTKSNFLNHLKLINLVLYVRKYAYKHLIVKKFQERVIISEINKKWQPLLFRSYTINVCFYSVIVDQINNIGTLFLICDFFNDSSRKSDWLNFFFSVEANMNSEHFVIEILMCLILGCWL